MKLLKIYFSNLKPISIFFLNNLMPFLSKLTFHIYKEKKLKFQLQHSAFYTKKR